MKEKKSLRITSEMEGKVCLVTGASRGIGFYTARGLASRGAHVVMVSHHQTRGERASRKINGYVLKNRTDFIQADLSSQEQIHDLAGSFKEKYDRLDVLVNNAGGFFQRRRESVDGLELTFTLNHLNYFMTTLLLLEPLLTSDAPRVVNVASEAHRGGKIHFDDLQLEQGYSGRKAYDQSKLANLLFTYELARRLVDTPLTANALHPGLVNTNLGKQNKLVRMVMDPVHALLAKDPAKGSETPVYLAASPEVEGTTGSYFIKKEPVRSSEASYDTESAERLWAVSEELCGLDMSEIDTRIPNDELAGKER